MFQPGYICSRRKKPELHWWRNWNKSNRTEVRAVLLKLEMLLICFEHKNFIPLFAATYLRRFRREQRLRLKLEEDLVLESRKRSYFEDAINSFQKWLVKRFLSVWCNKEGGRNIIQSIFIELHGHAFYCRFIFRLYDSQRFILIYVPVLEVKCCFAENWNPDILQFYVQSETPEA